MIINASTIQGLYDNLNVRWNKGKELYTPEYSKIASVEPSTGSIERYAWLGRSPRMRKFVGEKLIKSLRTYKYELTNDEYEASIAVKKTEIEDGELLGIGQQAQDFGLSAAQLYDDLACNMGFNGMFSEYCFDDQFFVDTDHPLYNSNGTVSTYSNKITKKLSAASAAAADASIGAAIEMMENFKDEEGTPMGGTLSLRLIVSPSYAKVARKLANNEFLANGESNDYQGLFDVYVNRWITTANKDYWALINVGSSMKPFIIQERKAPQFVYVDAGNGASSGQVSERMFMKNEYLFGNEARGTYGYSFPWLIVGSDGTVA